MTTLDLDKVHDERLDRLWEKLPKRRDKLLSSIFVGERVIQTIEAPKILVEGYRLATLLPLLPFSPVTYVSICPGCLTNKDEVGQFIALTQADLIIPVLTGKYRDFPDSLVETLKRKDHVSAYENHFYYSVQSFRLSDGPHICEDCFAKHKGRLLKKAAKVNGVSTKTATSAIDYTIDRLYPLISRDYEIIAAFEAAIDDGNPVGLKQIANMVNALHDLRMAQVWNGVLPLSSSDLADLPEGISKAADEGRSVAFGLRRYIAEGLGLRVPLDVPIDRYADLVREFQPRISSIVDRIINQKGANGKGFDAMSREISRLNNEIDRIKNLKRYLIIEAIAEPMKKNKAVVAASLIAGILGLGGYLVGCAGALATAGAIKVAGKAGLAGKWRKS